MSKACLFCGFRSYALKSLPRKALRAVLKAFDSLKSCKLQRLRIDRRLSRLCSMQCRVKPVSLDALLLQGTADQSPKIPTIKLPSLVSLPPCIHDLPKPL